MTETVDIEGNSDIRCWFSGLTSNFRITTNSEVEVTRADPFAYLPGGEGLLPYSYSEASPVIGAYQGHPSSEEVRRLAEEISRAANYEVSHFLPMLTTAVQERCRQIYRAEGPPMEAAQTLWRGEGSCRDLAVVFVEACRAMGMAARFVSGYFAGNVQDSGELHAWAEVYVEGGGWRGFDPTGGLAVADEHIVVAAAARSQDAAPTTGSYRGDAAAELITNLRISHRMSNSESPEAARVLAGRGASSTNSENYS